MCESCNAFLSAGWALIVWRKSCGDGGGVIFASGVAAFSALCLRQELIDLIGECGHGLWFRHAESPHYPLNFLLEQIRLRFSSSLRSLAIARGQQILL